MHWSAGVLVVLLGCGDQLSPDECRREATALQALLRSVDTEPAYLYIDASLQLVKRTDLPASDLRYAPVVELRAHETVVADHRVASTAELRTRLEAAHAQVVARLDAGRAARPDPPDPAAVYFEIDARVPWPRVVEAWQAARDVGLRAPAFVFGVPRTLTPPPRAPIDSELDTLFADPDVSARATRYAELVQQEVQRCPGVVRSFGRVSEVEGETKSQTIIRELGPALVECGCRVSIPNLRAALWRLLASTPPTRVVRFDPAAPAQPITLPASATWADAAARFPADLKNAELAVGD